MRVEQIIRLAVEGTAEEVSYLGDALFDRTHAGAGVVNLDFDRGQLALDRPEPRFNGVHSPVELSLVLTEGIDCRRYRSIVGTLGLHGGEAGFDLSQGSGRNREVTAPRSSQ